MSFILNHTIHATMVSTIAMLKGNVAILNTRFKVSRMIVDNNATKLSHHHTRRVSNLLLNFWSIPYEVDLFTISKAYVFKLVEFADIFVLESYRFFFFFSVSSIKVHNCRHYNKFHNVRNHNQYLDRMSFMMTIRILTNMNPMSVNINNHNC